MPLSPEQEALCERLENGESTPTAAALIRQQVHEIDDLWDRLSRAPARKTEDKAHTTQTKRPPRRRPIEVDQFSLVIVRCISGGILHVASDIVRRALRLIQLSFRLHLRIARHLSDGALYSALSLIGGTFDAFAIHWWLL